MAMIKLSLVFVFLSYVVDARNLLQVISPATPTTTDNPALCSSTKHPKLCQWLVATYHPTTRKELRDAAIKDTIKKATIAKAKADKMVMENAKDEILANRIRGCSTAFDDVATTLTEAQNYLKSGADNDARVYIGASSSLIEGCHDVFDYYNEGIDYPTKRLYEHISKLSMNTISLSMNTTSLLH